MSVDEDVYSAISSLPEDLKKLIYLHHRDNLSHREIAERLNMKETKVAEDLEKAMRQLRQELRYGKTIYITLSKNME